MKVGVMSLFIGTSFQFSDFQKAVALLTKTKWISRIKPER